MPPIQRRKQKTVCAHARPRHVFVIFKVRHLKITTTARATTHKLNESHYTRRSLMDWLHVKQEKSHGRNSTPPPLATSAKLCLIDHRYLDTSRSYGTQDRSISTVYSCPFNQLSLIVIERHTRFLQSKQGTEVDEPTRLLENWIIHTVGDWINPY